MITDFNLYGIEHMISLLIPLLLGALFVFIYRAAKTEEQMKYIRIALAVLIIAIRSSRYIMDLLIGRFEIFDLFSLHICHIDLILLVICLIRPNKVLFNFVFIIGIPMGLSVALFPGTTHPEPGVARAMLFITSHTMLVVGALFLLIVERMNTSLKALITLIVTGNIAIVIVYIINKALKTNFLYVMSAPQGTILKSLDNIFGWPMYVVVMDILAIALMLIMYFVGQLIYKMVCVKRGDKYVLQELRESD